jgi:two-component system phosphate regulon sensor histidine kinase PhoR
LEQTEKSLVNFIDTKNIKITKQLANDLKPINGNKDEVLRIFDNLLSNALKYSPEHSNVIIKIYNTNNFDLKFSEYLPEQNLVCCEFIDQGEGISEENLLKLSERFFRVDKARSRKVGGTGLGLSIVKNMLNNHDAKMVVTSKINVGSNFLIYFPMVSV